jgi:S-methylmethionine-dependent homocysteine/selenocysteine methylase
MYIGGLMGCRGDAYKATEFLNPTEAKEFHSWQANLFLQAGVDFLYAGIMPTLPETIGMAMAMEQTELPYIISFMLRDTGRLLDGTTINDAIEKTDSSVKRKPVCYMTNCIHPSVLYKALSWDFNQTTLVKQRFQGIQANTSQLPPEQLDNSKI